MSWLVMYVTVVFPGLLVLIIVLDWLGKQPILSSDPKDTYGGTGVNK